MRTPHLDLDRFRALFGDDELRQLAGTGGWNTPDGPQVDTARIELAIANADQLVEGFLSGRYPPGTAHALLTQAAADVARYRLRSDVNAATVAEEVRRRHDDALRLLRDVQAGRQALTDAAGLALGVADGPGGTVMTTLSEGRAQPSRSAEALRGWL